MKMKKFTRILCLVLSAVLVLGLFAGALATIASAAVVTHQLAELLTGGKIKALGRTQVNTSGDGITANWSGNGFEMNVNSNGGDFVVGYKTNTNNGYAAVLVDGVQVWRGALYGTGTITVPLSAGKHTVSAIREHGHTNSTTSYIHFTTVKFDGSIEAKPADKALYIEVVGDSYACGAGSAAEYEAGVQWGDADHTAQGAFGWYLAKMLNADLSIVARGGIGLFDGTSEQEGTPNTVTMRDIYPYASGHNQTDGLYSFARKPDLVVIELGANDGIDNNNPTKSMSNWAAKLREMISLVRQKNGADTKILLLSHNSAKYVEMLKIADADENIWSCHFSHHGNGSAALATQTAGHPSTEDEYEIAEALYKTIQDNRILAAAEAEPTYNDIVYYVSESGNDANNGKTIGTAKKTVKAAWEQTVADNKTFANGSRLVFRIQGTVQYSTTGDQTFTPGTKKTADGKNLPILVTTYNYNGTKAVLDSGIAAINDGHGDMVIHNSVTFKDITFQSTTRSDGQFRHRNLHTGYGDVVFDNVTFAHAGAAPAKNNSGWRIGCGTGFGSESHPTTLTHSSVTFKNGDYTNLDFASAVLSNSMWKSDGTIYSLPTAEFHVIIEEGAKMGTVYGAWGTLAVAGATVELNGGTVEKLYPTWSAPSNSSVTYNTNIKTIFNGGKLNDPRFMGTGAYNTINGDVTVEFKRGQYIGALFTAVGNNTTVNGNVTNNISGGEIRLNPTSTTVGADGIYLGSYYGVTVNGNVTNNISGGDLNLIFDAPVDCGIYLGLRGGSLNGNLTNNISGGNLMAVNGNATASSSGIYLGMYSGHISGTLTNNISAGTLDGGINFGDRTIGNKIGKIVNVIGVKDSLQGPRILNSFSLGGGWAYLGNYVGNRALTADDCSDTVVLDTTIYSGYFSGAVYAGVNGSSYNTTHSYVSGSVKTDIYGGNFPGGFYGTSGAAVAGHVTTNIYGGTFTSIYGTRSATVFDGVETNIYGMKEYYAVKAGNTYGIWAGGNTGKVSAKTAGRDAVKLTIAPTDHQDVVLNTPIYAGFAGAGSVTGNTTVSVSGGIYPKGFKVTGKTVGEALASGCAAYNYTSGQKLSYAASDAAISGYAEIRAGAPAATRTIAYYVRPNGSDSNDGKQFISAKKTIYGAMTQAVTDNGGSRVFPNGTKLVIYVDGTVSTNAGQSMGYYNLLTTADGKHMETVVTTYNYSGTKATIVQSHTPTDGGSSTVYMGTDMTFKDVDIVSRKTSGGFVTQNLYAAGCNLTFDNANLYTDCGTKWMVAADHFSTGGQNPASGNRMDSVITFRNGDYTGLSYVTTNNANSVWISSGNTLTEAPNMHCKVVIEDGAKMANVYGPVGKMKIGSATVEVRGGEISNLYGTGSGTKDIKVDSVLNVSGGTIGTLNGTGTGANVKMNADVYVNISGGTVNKFNGSGKEATVNGDIHTTISGGTVKNFDGSGEKAIINGNVTNTFSGGTITGVKFNGLYNNTVLTGNLTNNFTGAKVVLNPVDTGNGVDAIFLSGRSSVTINGNVTNNVSAGSLGIEYKVTGIKSGIYFGLRGGWINGNMTNNITGGEIYCRPTAENIAPSYAGIHLTGFSGASVKGTLTNNVIGGTFETTGSYYFGQQGIDGSTGKVINVVGDKTTGTGPSFLGGRPLNMAGGWGRIGVNNNASALPADGVIDTIVVDTTIYGGTFTGDTIVNLNATTGTNTTYIKGSVKTVVYGGTFTNFYANGNSPTYGNVTTDVYGGTFRSLYGARVGKVHGDVTLNIHGMTEAADATGIWAAGVNCPIVGDVTLTIRPEGELTLGLPISAGHSGAGTVGGTTSVQVTGGTYTNGFAVAGVTVKEALATGLVPLKTADNTVVKVTDAMTTTGTDPVKLVSSAWTDANASIALSKTSVSYDGKNDAEVPTETVKFGNTTLVKNTDYTVSYLRDGAATTDLNSVGTVTVKVTAKAPYSGTLTTTYTIARAGAVGDAIAKVTNDVAAYNSATVTADHTAALAATEAEINKILADNASVLTASEKTTLNGLLTTVDSLQKVISDTAAEIAWISGGAAEFDAASVNADDAAALAALKARTEAIRDGNLTAAQKITKQNTQAHVAHMESILADVASDLAAAKTEAGKYDAASVTADDSAKLTELAASIAAIPNGNLNAAQQTEKQTLASRVTALQKVISDAASDLAKLESDVAAYDVATVTPAHKSAVEALLARCQAFPTANLTAAQKQTLNTLVTKCNNLLAAMGNAASAAIAAVSAEVNALKADSVTLDDNAKFDSLRADIDKVSADYANVLTAAQKQTLKELSDAVSALKQKVVDVNKQLADVKAEAAKFSAADLTADDSAKLTELVAAIAALPDGNLTAAQKTEKQNMAATAAQLQSILADVASDLAAAKTEVGKYNADSVTADDSAKLTELAASIAAIPNGNLTSAQQTEKQTLASQVAALQKVISDTASQLAAAKTKVASYDAATVNAGSTENLNELATEIAAINDGNLTSAQKAEKKALASQVAALQKVISDAAANLDALAAKVAAYDMDDLTSADKAKLQALAAEIAAFPAGNLTDTQKAQLADLATAVDTMIAAIEKAEEISGNIDAIAAMIQGKTVQNVTSADAANLAAAKKAIQELRQDDTLSTVDQQRLTALETTVTTLEKQLAAAQDAAEVPEATDAITPETVQLTDKAALTDAIAALEKAEADFGANYTAAEKQAIADAKAELTAALKVIEAVETVEAEMLSLPATAEPDDEAAIAAIEKAVAAYLALSDRQKEMVGEAALKRVEQLSDALLDYRITKGDDAQWTQGSETDITITVNGLLSKFKGLLVDGSSVDSKFYTLKSGSTIITLSDEFLESLSKGEHSITVQFTDGQVEGSFTVKAKAVSPETADTAQPLLLALLALFSLTAASAVTIYKKKSAR